ncbi:MAG: lipopolysaccharide heptosyltransferase II [Methylococcaceae bacterium]|nr:lipopolysaccharide heptosyltransferase II [Methylococcaceae bacterium]
MSNPAKILVVGPSWVGDMVMAQSLFMSLKVSFPDCQIDVLAPPWSLPLLERMPEVLKGIPMSLKHGEFGLLARFRLGKPLRSERYDQAIVLPNSWKSALIPFFAGIPKRTGFIGECRWGLLNDARTLDKQALTMTVQRFVALGLPVSSPQPPAFTQPSLITSTDGQRAVIEKFNISADGKILALCPGAEFGPSKRWPAEHFAEVAKAKIEQGWQVWLLGSEKDKESAETIVQLTNNQCRNFVGQTTLIEAIDLMSLSNTVVANDSGLMHLAAALNKKVIALYGSTPPEFAPPLCASATSVSLNLPCSPCRKRICPLYPVAHPEHTKCLTGIKPERIMELIGD